MSDYENYNQTQDEILVPTKSGYLAIPAPDIRHPRPHAESQQQPKDNNRATLSFRKSNIGLLNTRILNLLHFAVMLSSMIGVIAYLGYAIGGPIGLFIISAIGLGLFFGSTNIKIEHILRLKNVQFVHPDQNRTLYQMISELTTAGRLSAMPALFYSNSPEINAYTLQDDQKSAIVLSRGMLNFLNQRELYSVLAHEVAHIKNSDVRIMLMAEQIRRITGFMSLIGQLLLLINLPLILMNQLIVPWSMVLLLMGAPIINMLLMVAISRNREYRADLDAALLTDDPAGLASALKKINQQASFWQRLYAPYRRNIPSILRTHPNMTERIKRLGALYRQETISRKD